MRLVQLGLLAALLVGGDALAKDKKKGKHDDHGPAHGIEKTGIQSFDRVFREVRTIDERLFSTESQLRAGRTDLNAALGLKRGTPFADAIAELKEVAGDKVTRGASNGAIPTLQVSDAVPSNVKNAVDGFNSFTANLGGSLEDLGRMPADIDALVKETRGMPSHLVEEFTKAGYGGILDKIFKLPKTTKALKHNLEVVGGLDDRVKSVTTRLADLGSLVTTEFAGPSDRHGDGRRGGDGGGPKKGKKKKKGGGR